MNTPAATYRLQLNGDFTFESARNLVPYLENLGISHLYLSPVLKARKGSAHGYDVTDPATVNPELGGEEGFIALSEELKKAGMSIMQDIVPNHMAYDKENSMLMDILEKGPRSPYLDFFDIDWDHAYENLRGRLLAPFLGSFYGEVLENGELRLSYDSEGLSLNYYDFRFPLRVESYTDVFGGNAAEIEAGLGPGSPNFTKFAGAVALLKNLSPSSGEPYPEEQVSHAKKMLWDLYSSDEAVRNFMDSRLKAFNGEKGKPESFDDLDRIISSQFYRLSRWKVAAEEINYRRFFTINDLISLRIEKPRVFDHVHALILKMVREGRVSALRVDHVDGLMDPKGYLARLREAAGPDVYVVVEKILEREERLPGDWSVQGTTGYDFTNWANRLFCRPESEKDFIRLYYKFSKIETPYEELVCAKKRMIISKHLAGNIDNLAQLMKKAAAGDRYGRDITLYGLRRTLVEVMANFPVYRTYAGGPEGPREAEKKYVRAAVEGARKRLPGFEYELNFVESFLLMEEDKFTGEEKKKEMLNFVMHFQQYTAPLMAKGFEDTVLYIYNKIVSLNEVGGAPNVFGVSAARFHEFAAERAKSFPLTMNATSTHDGKRGEDARARINVLSEMPKPWKEKLRLWSKMNAPKKRRSSSGKTMPSRNDEYFIYQAIIGSFPVSGAPDGDFGERIKSYAVKAAREAGAETNWISPRAEYEDAYLNFINEMLAPGEDNNFLEDFIPFQRKISFYGYFNSLSQALLKICVPGVPDFYRGSELWNLDLVDPDNRRPVDFGLRERTLSEMKSREGDLPGLISELLRDLPSGKIKLFLVWKALSARKAEPEIFEKGDYVPLNVRGEKKENLLAFSRNSQGRSLVCAVPRFLSEVVSEGTLPLGKAWEGAAVSVPGGGAGEWTDVFTGARIKASGEIPAAELFASLPFALLLGKP